MKTKIHQICLLIMTLSTFLSACNNTNKMSSKDSSKSETKYFPTVAECVKKAHSDLQEALKMNPNFSPNTDLSVLEKAVAKPEIKYNLVDFNGMLRGTKSDFVNNSKHSGVSIIPV
jgi:hypothetical protein